MTISPSAEAPPEAVPSRFTKWAIGLFFVMLFIPGSFNLGIRMTPYRLYLMIMAVPMFLRIVRDPTFRITAVDVLLFVSLSWQSATILLNHGTAYVVFAGASLGEYFLGYLLGRVYIRSAADFRYFFRCFLITLVAFLPFALVEVFTHKRLLRSLAAHLLEQPPVPRAARERFGLLRAQLSFETFLVYGAFCAVGFANVFYSYWNRFPRNVVYAGFVGFMTALAISTSSLMTVFIQAVMIAYDLLFRWFRYKWVLFVILALFPLLFIRIILDFVLSEVMFSSVSGQSRALHYEYALKEILRHPLLGVGMNRWASPYWLSQVTDSFWLSLPLRAGIPATLLVIGFFAVHFWRVAAAAALDRDEAMLRTGYLISFASVMIAFSYNTFFAVSQVFFMMYCAAGAWFYAERRPVGPRRPVRTSLQRRSGEGRGGGQQRRPPTPTRTRAARR